jgi:alkylhydroperoxidase family enzyme
MWSAGVEQKERAMPVIEPVPWDDLDPGLREEIAAGQRARVLTSTTAVQIWAYQPEAAKHWIRTMVAMHEAGSLDERVRELVRLQIAAVTQCRSCQVARKSDTVTDEDVACLAPDDPRFTPREQAALRFAQLFAADPLSIDPVVFEELRQHFSVDEIVDLGMFSGLMLAGGRLNEVLGGYPDDERLTIFPWAPPAGGTQREKETADVRVASQGHGWPEST